MCLVRGCGGGGGVALSGLGGLRIPMSSRLIAALLLLLLAPSFLLRIQAINQ
jgi:hypothetical protein